MNKIGLIIKREYLRRVSKKSFILLTLLTPFLFAALVFVPLWLSTIKGDEVRNVAIIDTTGKYASLFENNESFHFIHSDKTLDEYRQGEDKEVFAFLSITDDLLNNPKAATLYSEKQVPAELSRLVNQTLSKQLESEKLASFNIPNLKEIIRESKINFNVQTIKWSEDGKESASSATVASIIGMVFTFIIYMFIMMYGAMVMQGVMEEKTNRIIEVMISSVRPFDLMMGKIIGIGFVGLTQVFLWGIITTILVSVGGFMFSGGVDVASLQAGPQMGMMDANALASSSGNEIMGIINSINIAEIGISFIIYFIGGYMLYASIFAAIGSAVDSQEDTQQFMAPVTIFMIFALYAGIYSMENPDGPLAFWCSMVPFTSPIVMMVRIPFEIPLWEKLLSVFLLYASAIGIVWLSAKIYRVGILMYGKKPSIKEMVKWIKYK
ncbi:ABC transporter permease [Parabacteroides goldsteinii]|uniref:ABC transporter permease n=1 Tax=Parabacteroides goldsteinii TaxID=328812 RepID=UPI00266E9D72|nr:ABC transporter permease [Parabacteroides goldsteinii]